MLITIDSIQTPALWAISDQAPTLEIYANDTFYTSDGKLVPAGSVQQQDFCHRVIGTIVDGVASFPAIIGIYSTEDALDNQLATYSAYIRAAGREPIPWQPERFSIPRITVPGATSLSWPTIAIHSAGVKALRSSDVYTKQQTLAAIQAALLSAGLTTSGMSSMINGVAFVGNNQVLGTSKIFAQSMSEDVSGNLYVPAGEIAPGISFQIHSTNAGDNGDVAWVLIN